jgi:non-specific serine/threonine protein kinase
MPARTPAGDEQVQPASLAAYTDSGRNASRLPDYLTTFVGREQELARLSDLLGREDVRLLTLTGPGGIGKTRLGVLLATEVARDFADGVVFIPLASVARSDLVLPTIARTLEVTEHRGFALSDLLVASLQHRHLLLLLDNFEHVIDAAVDIAEILTRCPKVKVLVTSRVVLRVQGEQEFAVPPMTIPARGPGRTWQIPSPTELAHSESVTLFVQRARSVMPTFELTDDNALAVIEICRRLDGLPLAIELAAARVKLLSPAALLSRLAGGTQVLSAGARDQPKRLQTMRNAILWSYDLLNPAEQTLFQQLAVFANGFTLDAAEAVMRDARLPIDTLDGVASLMDNSLVREIDVLHGERRFMMLETIREFGLEQLAASEDEASAYRRHAAWCAALAERAEPELGGPDAVAWLDRLEREHDNVRQALAWLFEQGDIETAARITRAIWMFWFFRCYFHEARGWLDRTLESLPDRPSPLRTRMLGSAGLFAEAVGDFGEAEKKLGESRRMALALDDKVALAMALLGLGDVADNTGQYERAEALLRAANDLFRETGSSLWLVLTLAFLGTLTQRRGDEEAAASLMHEALALSRQIGFLWGTAICLNRVGRLAHTRGDDAEAARLYGESLGLWRELGDYWRMSRQLIDLAEVAADNGQFEHAARLLGAAEAINEPIGASESFVDDSARQRTLQLTSEHLTTEAFDRAWAAGQAMSLEAAVAMAMAPLATDHAPAERIPSSDPGHGLTARELEVLELLTAGRSDREIAETLFISRRTAQGHVASIFNKFGVNSRTAAATAALRAGLVRSESA